MKKCYLKWNFLLYSFKHYRIPFILSILVAPLIFGAPDAIGCASVEVVVIVEAFSFGAKISPKLKKINFAEKLLEKFAADC